ncbi:iron-sulfur cluster assembly scaffold protein [Lacipirellula parvula]|uniref:NIF system FeS cluster assembly NifU N-terminal domain-containing protein n=1 Tax=Lacipirellula parvula TaxID=2650471 RepID=A0A5K7XMU3_9BACT|nr:iron-sulfur cluster assembly scaffold protein [Lacipirellula parvula]BBO34429.1 hypothetical protein PLANPX_4041 [Lacipirellula parvula]
MSRFSETLLEHARHPRHFGRDDEAELFGQAGLENGPPRVEIYLRVANDVITRVTFYAAGCGVTIGACSALSELIEGCTLREAASVDTLQLTNALDGVPSDKGYCLNVCIAALRNALARRLLGDLQPR